MANTRSRSIWETLIRGTSRHLTSTHSARIFRRSRIGMGDVSDCPLAAWRLFGKIQLSVFRPQQSIARLPLFALRHQPANDRLLAFLATIFHHDRHSGSGRTDKYRFIAPYLL